MPDREKVIKGLEELEGFLFKEYTNIKAEESKIYYDRFKSLSDAIDLLKEQEDLGKELENAIELIHKKNARIEILNTVLNEQPQIVRCKDCKHRYFADNRIPSEQANVCGRNGIDVTPDWFCADGERKPD